MSILTFKTVILFNPHIKIQHLQYDINNQSFCECGITTKKSVYCGGYFRINWRL